MEIQDIYLATDLSPANEDDEDAVAVTDGQAEVGLAMAVQMGLPAGPPETKVTRTAAGLHAHGQRRCALQRDARRESRHRRGYASGRRAFS